MHKSPLSEGIQIPEQTHMETSELDRLGESVKQIVEQLTQVKQEREHLREETQTLQQRLAEQAKETNRIAEAVPKVTVAPEKLEEISKRLLALAEALKQIEANI